MPLTAPNETPDPVVNIGYSPRKLLILGHGRHGKDTVAELLRDEYNISFESSSMAAAEIAVYPTLSEKYGYKTLEECYEDRVNHREEWKQLITEFNSPDKSKLCRMILARNDCYVGMRCDEEFAASKDLFDLIIWVDASERCPPDPTMKIQQTSEMLTINNNGHRGELKPRLLDTTRLFLA